MKPLPSKVARPLTVAVYLLPLLVGIFLLIWAVLPHMFYFLPPDDPRESLSLFDIMGDTWDTCGVLLNGNTTPENMYFPYIMGFCVILSWISIILYAVAALPAAICSVVAFCYPPTARNANLAKRWLQIFCPNRCTYVIFQLLPIFPALFPIVLTACLRSMFPGGEKLVLLYEAVIPDWVLVGALVLFQTVAFLLLIPSQKKERMDMFTIYKSKK